MTSIEDRLTRDVAEVTSGVVVTESDLQAARRALDQRIDRTRGSGPRRAVAAAAVAAVVVGGVAAFDLVGRASEQAPPADPGPTTTAGPDAAFLTGDAPTREDLLGLWRVDNGQVLVEFAADGTVRFDDRGTLFSDPVVTGTYDVGRGHVTMATTDSRLARCSGAELDLRASLPEDGVLRFLVSDASTARCSILPRGHQVLEQVLPTRNEGMAGLVFSREPYWQPLAEAGADAALGVWLAEGGGHVLELDRGGSYYVADASGTVDRGRWSLRGPDLVLTSSARSAVCDPGDQLVLGGVEKVDPGTTGVRGAVRRNDCGGSWTPAAWILLPHKGS